MSGRPTSGLNAKTVFAKSEVRRIEQLIDHSGIVPVLEPLLPSGGRCRVLQLRTLLVGTGLVAAADSTLYVRRAHEVLIALPAPTRRRLGVTWTDGYGREHAISLRQVEHLFGLLARLVDGSEHFASKDEDEQTRATRSERLELVNQLVLAASQPPEWRPNGHVAIDATLLDANSRPVHTLRRKQLAAAAKKVAERAGDTDLASLLANDRELAKAVGIPDFGEDQDVDSARMKRLRVATRRANDPDAATIVATGKLRHAFAAHLAVALPSEADVTKRLAHETELREAAEQRRDVRVGMPEPTPHLVLGLQLTASTTSPAGTAVDLTRRMVTGPNAQAAGVDASALPEIALLPNGDTVADRGYSDALPSDYHLPLKALGRRLIFDLHKNHRGITAHHRGAVVAFGAVYSPGIADYVDLVSKDAPIAFASHEEWRRHFHDAKLRSAFRLQPNGGADAEGYQRFSCPAQRGRGATVGCERRGTTDLVGKRQLLEVFVSAAGPLPDVCTKVSITLPPDVTARTMDFEWGGEQWYDSFVRRRPRVEGHNGILKNPAFAALEHMNIRVRGRAKFGLFVLFATAIANLRAGDRWRQELARVRRLNAEIEKASKSRAKRRSHTLNQLIPKRHRVDELVGARGP